MKKHLKYLASLAIVAMSFASCQKTPAALNAPIVKASTNSIVITEFNDEEIVKFEWSSASDKAAVQYALQITTSTDSEYASGVSMNMNDQNSKSFSSNEIASLMKELSISEDTPSFALIARVRATSAGLNAVNSENVSLSVSMDLPAYIPETLYIMGNATDFGWNRGKLDEQGLTKGENGIFTWTGNLYKTDSDGFKFVEPASGEFIPCYVRNAEAKDYWTLRLLTDYNDDLDIKFQVEEDGIYNLTLDVINLTIVAERTGDIYIDPDKVVFEELIPIGEAFDWGWSIDNAIAMENLYENHFRFVGHLNANKEFKFLCQRDWSPAFVRDVDAENYWSIVYSKSIDEKFQVEKEGYYIISIFADMKAPTIELKEYAEETIYLIGGAFDWGWSQDDAQKMSATENIGEYTWTGALKGGEDFKFLCQNDGNWTPGYNRDDKAESPWAVVYRPDDNGADEKFQVEKDGTYTLTLNVIERTLKAELK